MEKERERVRGGGGGGRVVKMSAPSTSRLSAITVRVIEVKYGCFTV